MRSPHDWVDEHVADRRYISWNGGHSTPPAPAKLGLLQKLKGQHSYLFTGLGLEGESGLGEGK